MPSVRAGLLALAALGCAPASELPPVLTLEGARPEETEGVFLNEQLVFHFSEPLDPASVTSASVRIRPRVAPGTTTPGAARGQLVVAGRALVFTPDPVLSFDLGDGGYRPGTTYAVELAGFPRPEGLRGRSGAPLAESALFSFSTVDASEPRAGPLFEDPAPGRGLPLILRTETVGPSQAIELEGGEPLDPSTLFAGDFVLRAGPRVRAELGPPIPLRARLKDNRDRRTGQGSTVVELLPGERLEAGETYQLIVDERLLRLRDFGGHRVIVRNAQGRAKLEIRVEPPAGGPAEAYLEYTESFIDDRLRSPEPVPGVDGTIRWTDTGRAEVRWPRSAGSGVDGAIVLAEHHLADDVEATSLALPAGRVSRLNAVPGLVVLRAQGLLALAGELERATGTGFGPAAELPFVLEESERADSARPVGAASRPGEPLADWLLRARRENVDWTVLIAGGDLLLDGRLASDGPLMLVAGGEIRIAAGARLEAPFVATVGHRPDLELRYHDGQRPAHAWRADLALEPPASNPLAAPLVLGVRSAPIPEVGGAARWHPGPRVGGRAGSGSWHLRYLGRPAAGRGSSREELVVDDPAMLEESPTVRFELRFELAPGRPGEPWDPPWLDSVQVRWDPPDPVPAGARR